MKKLLLTASAAAICALACMPAHAECDGIYGALRSGIVKHDMKKVQGDLDRTKLMISGAIGYRYEYFRTELEYIWRKYNKDENGVGNLKHKQMFKTYSYMWNLYYDILPYNWWSPYASAGIGLTRTRYSDRDKQYTHDIWKTTKFTWSVGGGLSLKVTNRFNVDGGYRYYDFGKPHKYDVTAHEIYAGIRYVF